ncbi:hypothetical protein D7Y13_06615 [Corallococcus praedator]|uniref:Lipoprotein n=1 Tax=Corallococcus praedator TaxID=2316724 RepID=A0ABX9QNE1_9BACT|nr:MULTISPECIES: hypothetical protein [Corallococcus]RKH11037.1 hypothetical protein D7X74_26300 [Corallococcus sp. CA047B]RKH26092.1 hypothetical protein D7X75_28905 [Corallococcus sp. CA031C]RKI14186.1 hypothetical protein D7Y13_06615 [Corallococcus praedator]
MRRATCLALTVLATACGDSTPTQGEINDATARVERIAASTHLVRGALEVLGLMPVYTCGEPRRSFLNHAVEGLSASVSCATATVTPVDDVTDSVLVKFAEGGCSVHGLRFTGQARLEYQGGEDLMEMHADLRGMTVDGQPLQAKVGYGTCGDEARLFADVEGDVPGRAGHTFRVNSKVGKREGLPIIGGTSLIFDGPGELTGPAGTDRFTLTGLEYEVGNYLPKEGTALLETAEGRTLKIAFQPVLWRVGKAEITVDDKDPVTVPVLR